MRVEEARAPAHQLDAVASEVTEVHLAQLLDPAFEVVVDLPERHSIAGGGITVADLAGDGAIAGELPNGLGL